MLLRTTLSEVSVVDMPGMSSIVSQRHSLTPIKEGSRRVLSTMSIVGLCYFAVSGGPIGSEQVISSGGPLVGFICLLLFPFVWSVPISYVTAELCTAFPENAIGGKFLSNWIVISTFCSNGGQYIAELFCDSFQILGMAECDLMPAFLKKRNERFDTPHNAIFSGLVIIFILIKFEFEEILGMTNALSAFYQLLILLAFVKLRFSHPDIERPVKVPGSISAIVSWLMIPSAMLVYIGVDVFTSAIPAMLVATVVIVGFAYARWKKFTKAHFTFAGGLAPHDCRRCPHNRETSNLSRRTLHRHLTQECSQKRNFRFTLQRSWHCRNKTEAGKFHYVINGVAPPPLEGINGKLWATAVALCVWRQNPRWFLRLEKPYDKATLHLDDNVYQLARQHVLFDAIELIRPYNDEEARAIRERLAREAAAKRQQEEEEDARLKLQHETELMVQEFAVEQARQLPLKMQQQLVKGLDGDIQRACMADTHPFQIGERVECCWCRRHSTSRAEEQEDWFPCEITGVQASKKTVHIRFLDGLQERERSVSNAFVRRLGSTEKVVRDVQFSSLRERWTNPVPVASEVTRIQEYRDVGVLIRTATQRYKNALLFNERFHAFDEFATGLVKLVELSVAAVECVQAWHQLQTAEGITVRQFVWEGKNFLVTLARSLDYLLTFPELVEWYGEEFPFSFNPFMVSTALHEKGEDRGLKLSHDTIVHRSPLRTALRLHKLQTSIPTWWPEGFLSEDLRRRIASAEEN
ncbi:TPA: hypothetical protein N0F65_012615 [Lagenidium giganteum]|uniref:Uncharacterized protein n=1 Tax=Lagenidium giganteum TaxID=4803 RepID=A0AAV2YR69_9STRA|nr:TPA: hypothetical protein N0F65_012615 [Lagenidium giganteum]